LRNAPAPAKQPDTHRSGAAGGIRRELLPTARTAHRTVLQTKIERAIRQAERRKEAQGAPPESPPARQPDATKPAADGGEM